MRGRGTAKSIVATCRVGLPGLPVRHLATRSILSILIALGLFLTAAWSWAQVAPPTPTSGSAVAPATLTIWNRPIVVFRAQVNHVSPAARAAAAVARFAALPDDVRGDEIRALPATVGDLQGMMVAAREQVLFGIVDEDVDPTAGETLAEVSRRALAQLSAVIEARAEQRRPTVIAKGIGLSLGAAVLLGLILWGLRKATDRALLRLAETTHLRAISVLGVDVRRPLDVLERGLVRVTAWGLGLVAAYVWLTFSLARFPYTRPWAAELKADLLDSPEKPRDRSVAGGARPLRHRDHLPRRAVRDPDPRRDLSGRRTRRDQAAVGSNLTRPGPPGSSRPSSSGSSPSPRRTSTSPGRTRTPSRRSASSWG